AADPRPEGRPEPAAAVWAEVEALLGRPAEQFVRGLYPLLQGRAADPDGLAHHLTALASGASRADVVRGFAASEECRLAGTDTSWLGRLEDRQPSPASLPSADVWEKVQALLGQPAEQFVRGLYPLLLGRAADPRGLIDYLTALASGTSR